MPSASSRLATTLRDADDAWLAALLHRRPDLARPAPSSVTTLAARAATRGSVSRALATLSAPDLTALEAAVLLGSGPDGVTAAALAAAIGHEPGAAVQRLLDDALLLADGDALTPAPGVAEAVGPTPLGLGPGLRDLPVRQDEGWPTTPAALRAVLATAPDDAQRLLDALTWGPAVGTLGTTVPPAARWLLDHHVLHRLSATEVVLPREVALAARGGRLVRRVETDAPVPEAAVRRVDVVAAEAVAAADELVRGVEQLLARWSADPPGVLRAGGLAARDLKALATGLDVSVGQATLVAELAAVAGLVGHLAHADGTAWAPTAAAAAWSAQPSERRWADLARVWSTSGRVPWLAGTRTDKGVLRAALDPDLHRAWAAPLRRRVLAALAAWPPGAAPSAAQVRSHLGWLAPRSVPPETTVAAVLTEAAALGLLGAGALAPPARDLLAGTDPAPALAALYPPAVGDLIVQGDLTGVVPGRPTPELAALLEASADVDSRGAALTVRFTAASLARAVVAGWTAEQLLERLRAASRSGVPQPLEYLVGEAARRNRRVRVQPATAVVLLDDDADALALLSDTRLAGLGLRRVAPATLAADASAAVLHEALRAAGAAAALEGPDGRPVDLGPIRPRAARPVSLEGPPTESAADAAVVVAAVRAGEERTQALLDGADGAAGPEDHVELLRAAAAEGRLVRLVLAGNGGAAQERLVRPLSVDGGRVRALDASREAEITVATHRIIAVRPA